MTNTYVNALTVSGTNLFAGTGGVGVWRRPLSEFIVSVEENISIPTNYSLEQNYPNPFNPSTVINYRLPVSSFITLKVFDMLGREAATLVDEYQQADQYVETLHATSLPSGVYFYTLKAGNYVQTKK